MSALTLHLHRLRVALWMLLVTPRRRGDRGDVPGWVLVTVMSAGLVVALSAVAKDELAQLLRRALDQVQ